MVDHLNGNEYSRSTWVGHLSSWFLKCLHLRDTEEEVYVKIPAMLSDKNKSSEETVVLKLSNSIYGLVQAPSTWYQHLQKCLKSLEFEPSDLEKAIYYGQGMIIITYVDDCLFFGPDIKDIQRVIK